MNDQSNQSEAPTDSLLNRAGAFVLSQEFRRFFFCLIFLFASLLITSFALEVADFSRPPLPPLPDLIHDNVLYVPAEPLVNMFITAHVAYILVRILLHPQRLTVLRRSVMVYALAMLLRAVLILSIGLPDENPACGRNRSRVDFSASNLIARLFGGNTCGDLIYSGHTIGLLLPALVQGHYFGGAMGYIISFSALIQAFLIVVSKLHYGVDVAIALMAVSLLFWSYVNIAEKPHTFRDIPAPFAAYFRLMEW